MTDPMNLDRRSILERMALLIGVAVLPVEALAVPVTRTRPFLAPSQSKLLSAVSDTILPATDTPGAVAAGVPDRLDALLKDWASPETRSAIAGALARIDAAAIAQKQSGFAALTPVEREVVLRLHDASALKSVPPPPDAPKTNFFSGVSYVADPGYLRIKDLVINLYYYSEIAASHELIYEHVPGQWQPSIKLTPQSRPYLGVGPF